MNKNAVAFLALAAAVGLAACADPKQPSKGNFAAAIQRGLETADRHRQSLCLELPGKMAEDKASFSIEQPKKHFESGDARYDGVKQLNALIPLDEHGLLERVDSEFDGAWKSDYVRSTFTFTEKAKPLLNEGKTNSTFNAFLGRSNPISLCVGKLELIEVDSYTEPADLMGKRVSEVSARFRYVDLPAWTSQDGVTAYWGGAKRAANGEFVQKIALVLTGDGWMVAK